jgi:hypothetical protein
VTSPYRTPAESVMEWLGYPGHFIGADSCRFHLHTHITLPSGAEFCVSTVGDYRPRGSDKPQEIGARRLYETMVFRILDNGDPDYSEEHDMRGYNDRDAANAGHVEVCRLWASGGGEAR